MVAYIDFHEWFDQYFIRKMFCWSMLFFSQIDHVYFTTIIGHVIKILRNNLEHVQYYKYVLQKKI